MLNKRKMASSYLQVYRNVVKRVDKNFFCKVLLSA